MLLFLLKSLATLPRHLTTSEMVLAEGGSWEEW